MLLLTVFFDGQNLSKPFWGEHDWNGARYGNIAKNYVRYGLVETKLGQVENGGVSKPSDFIYYTHYQPLLPLLIAGSYKLFGLSEFATRLVPLIATAGFIIVLYLIGEMLFSKVAGVFMSLSALVTPMIRYYGKNPVHEPLALFFASIAFYGAVMIRNNNKKGWLVLLTGFILTGFTNWSYVFLLPALVLLILKKKNFKKIIILAVVGTILVGLHFLHIKILTGSFLGGNLAGALLERTSVDQVVTKFNLIDYILRVRLWSSTLFTNTLLVSSFAGLFLILKSKKSEIKIFIFSVFIYCCYPIFFANASFIHSYFIYYLIFPLSVCAGYFYAKLFEYKKILIIIVALAIFGIWFERNSYEHALEISNGDEQAVNISKLINVITKPDDTILIKPYDYEFSRLPILSYYSERNIISKGTADWIATVSENNFQLIHN